MGAYKRKKTWYWWLLAASVSGMLQAIYMAMFETRNMSMLVTAVLFGIPFFLAREKVKEVRAFNEAMEERVNKQPESLNG